MSFFMFKLYIEVLYLNTCKCDRKMSVVYQVSKNWKEQESAFTVTLKYQKAIQSNSSVNHNALTTT